MGRVLLIDDDTDVVSFLATALAEGGHVVFTALHAGDGLMLFESETPEIVVVDIKMPGMSGLEVLQQIRLRRPGLPVIVISGFGDETTAQQCRRRGAIGFLRKPFRVEQLQAAVTTALGPPVI